MSSKCDAASAHLSLAYSHGSFSLCLDNSLSSSWQNFYSLRTTRFQIVEVFLKMGALIFILLFFFLYAYSKRKFNFLKFKSLIRINFIFWSVRFLKFHTWNALICNYFITKNIAYWFQDEFFFFMGLATDFLFENGFGIAWSIVQF